MANPKIVKVHVKEDIKDNKYRKGMIKTFNIATKDHNIEVSWKERLVKVNNDIIIPFENVSYFTIEEGEKNE
jgi:hypothetical protein